jgi:chromosome segregation ATPase
MSEQQRKAGHVSEELRASVRRLERELDSVQQQASFRQERVDAVSVEAAQLKKDQHNTARRLTDATTKLELAAQLAADEHARADQADLQILELLAKHEALLRELSLAREARDACDLDAKKSHRIAQRAEARLKETEHSLAECSAVLANRAVSRAA